MRMLQARTQVLLSREQRERLERLAAERGVSVGALIREAIDRYLPPRSRSREEALETLRRLSLPVGDWEAIEAEILRGALR
jgi:predicted DNA-binding protein